MNDCTSKIAVFFSSPLKHGKDGAEYALDATSLREIEAVALHDLVRESGAKRTLEIGLALGGSAIAIAEALKKNGADCRHVAVDPYQRAFGHIGESELETLGLIDIVNVISRPSEEVLYEMARAGDRFDIIFNDGAHTIGDKVTNTYFADRCLTLSGIMVFHDAFLPATVASVQYLLQERCYEIIRLPPDSVAKRWLRVVRYALRYGRWFASKVVPFTCRSLVAVRKTCEPEY
jgi:predicted O-methyltransferase YrrM